MWFNNISKDSDVVISSRVRFARSIEGYKFPHMLNSKELNMVINLIDKAIDKDEYHLFKMRDIDEVTQNSLKEQHLISKEFVGNNDGAIVSNEDNTIVVMVNEEDHLRIQSFESGFNIDKCYENIARFTDALSEKVKFAKSDKYGYLISCPTNIGSAMRVSVMMHLPALAKAKLLNKLFDQAMEIGISVRGLYGENSDGTGNIFQISNQKTLGVSDEDIMYNIKLVVTSIIEQERKAREILLKSNIALEDSIYRAYGILKNARTIEEEEALDLLSKVRLGVSAKVIPHIPLEQIQSLMVDIEPNTLKTILKEEFNKEEENNKRAEYIRKELI
ncbi:MAG: protein arginine kinase [Clostridia bacterium]|nr:protein arginine kinase [Clostridia bacterium]